MPKHKKGLSPKQALFVKEYLVDLNASAAYRRAGYSGRHANSFGPKLLTNPAVAEAVAAAMAERGQKLGVNAEQVLAELKKIAFYDVRALFKDGVELIPICKLPRDIAACIAGCDLVTANKGEGKLEHVAKIKMADKLRALELCGRHIGMFREDRSGEDLPMPAMVRIEVVDGRLPTPSDSDEDAA